MHHSMGTLFEKKKDVERVTILTSSIIVRWTSEPPLVASTALRCKSQSTNMPLVYPSSTLPYSPPPAAAKRLPVSGAG